MKRTTLTLKYIFTVIILLSLTSINFAQEAFDYEVYLQENQLVGDITSCSSDAFVKIIAEERETNEVTYHNHSSCDHTHRPTTTLKKSEPTGAKILISVADGLDGHTAPTNHYQELGNIVIDYIESFVNTPAMSHFSAECGPKIAFGNTFQFPVIPENVLTENNLFAFANSTPGTVPNPLSDLFKNAQRWNWCCGRPFRSSRKIFRFFGEGY